MNNFVLETNGLTKSYGAVKALASFTVKLEGNKIYGLLGRNGAGKTTFLNLISSRIFADSGEVRLFGQNAVENQEALPQMCYMPEKNLFIPIMRVEAIIKSAAEFYQDFDMGYADTLCTKFMIDKRKKYKTLSRGYESVLRIIIGLASRAPITVFDDPVLGLDAAVRDIFYRELLEEYTSHPRTFIISTHLIEESADVFEEALIIKEGVLVEQLPVEELKGRARYVSGKADIVDRAVAGLKVLHSESVGNIKICAIYGQLTEDAYRKIASYEVDISPVPVQKLFIYLTNH